MDTSGFSQIGRYGTVSLIKRNDSNTAVASFGVDGEELTFGREPSCGVRLYYPDVSLLHCKIVFEDRKAFLVVLGESGVMVDDCKVYPHTSASESADVNDSGTSTIIPLMNNSEFEIHGKRFRFTYPPKDMRATLIATPPRANGRSLRLSMIQSAQVFSPRPSNNPKENLRVLQTPLRNAFKSPAKPRNPSPLKAPLAAYQSSDEEEDEEEDEIVLVEGNHPRVLEEDRDLVILEDVIIPPPAALHIMAPTPQRLLEPPKTPPRRRQIGGNALHRAVLIRSAQRAVLKAEQEREEEEEELEVMDTVVADESDEDEDEYAPKDYNGENELEDVEMRSPSSSEDEESDDEGVEEQEPEGDHAVESKPVWRKSLVRIWPFVSKSTNDEEDQEDNDKNNDQNMLSDEDEEENLDADPAPLPVRSAIPNTPIRRALGAFMTPQQGKAREGIFPRVTTDTSESKLAMDAPGPAPTHGRHSVGGAPGAQRVLLAQPWKVRELVVPSSSTSLAQPSPARRLFPVTQGPMTPIRPGAASTSGTPMRVPGTPISDQERQAIRERRRSAVLEKDTFFAGGIPGMGTHSPAKFSSDSSLPSGSSGEVPSSRNSLSPTKPARNPSPFKARPSAIPETDEEQPAEEELDTRSLLERMKETVEGMKRRRSMAPSTPIPSSRPSVAPVQTPAMEVERLDFTKLAQTPAVHPEISKAVEEVMGDKDDIDNIMDNTEPEPFSLLRSGEPLSLENTKAAIPEQVEEEVPRVLITPEDMPADEEVEKPKRRGRPRKATKKTDEETEEAQDTSKLAVATTARRVRSKSPIPQGEAEEIAPVKPPSRRTRKASAEPEPAAPTPVNRRGRNATSKESEVESSEKPRSQSRKKPEPIPEEESEIQPTPAPAKRGRPRKATVDETSTREEKSAIKPKPATKKTPVPKARATGKAKAIAPPVEENEEQDEDEDDPLDSYNPSQEIADPSPAPPPTKTGRGRKKVVAKQEEEETRLDEVGTSSSDKPRSGRSAGTSATTTKTPAATSTTRPRAPAGASSRRIKTPATAPAASGSGQQNKENAPDLNAGSGESDDAPVVKIRVSKTRGGTATTKGSAAKARAVKQDPEDEPTLPVRTTRTRTRTKTG